MKQTSMCLCSEWIKYQTWLDLHANAVLMIPCKNTLFCVSLVIGTLCVLLPTRKSKMLHSVLFFHHLSDEMNGWIKTIGFGLEVEEQMNAHNQHLEPGTLWEMTGLKSDGENDVTMLDGQSCSFRKHWQLLQTCAVHTTRGAGGEQVTAGALQESEGGFRAANDNYAPRSGEVFWYWTQEGHFKSFLSHCLVKRDSKCAYRHQIKRNISWRSGVYATLWKKSLFLGKVHHVNI